MRKSALAVILLALPLPAPACSLCGTISRSMSLAYEYSEASFIIYGTIANPKLDSKQTGKGTTEFHVERVIKDAPALPKGKTLLLSRYLPILDPKSPPKYVMFFRDSKQSLEPYWGKEITSPTVLDFVAELHKHRNEPSKMLIVAAANLDHANDEVADEAFMVFAKADDKLIAQAAKQLNPANLRKLVKNPDLEPERMSMFAYLLGACGNADDAKLLQSLVQNPPQRFHKAYEGILAGYITMRPQEGWSAANEMLKNKKDGFLLRYATMRALRFLYNAKPDEAGPKVMAAMKIALAQSEMADIAMQDLRTWKRWEHTKDVLACWNRPGYDSPIVKQNIIRYALACPLPECRELVARARQKDPDLVRDLEQELK